MTTTTAERLTGWLREVSIGRADRRVPIAGGVALLHSAYPAAHDHNHLLLEAPVDADAVDSDAVDADAERVLGGAGLSHRLVDVAGPALAGRLRPGLEARGYAFSRVLLMTCAEPPRRGSAAAVETIDLAERAATSTASWRLEQPGAPHDVARQLGERISTIISVVDATFLAVRGDGGRVVARCDLYLRDGVAQIEEVMTDVGARRRGLASALVTEAVHRARDAGADLVFLVADEGGRPAELYRRLGFVDAGTTASFSR